MTGSLRQGLASAVLGLELLERTLDVLEPLGVPVMPLKGLLLQQIAYASPGERAFSDVDVLVPEPHFGAACAALTAAGYLPVLGPGAAERSETFVAPGSALALDLHCRLFERGLYRMPTAEIFARARLDSRRFGRAVWLMDAYDAYAHLVGHLVVGRIDGRSERHLRDFAALAAGAKLDAHRCAAHLVHCGLARAARYALVMARDTLDDRFAAAVLGQLPADPVGDALAAWARRTVTQAPWASRWGIVPTRLLAPSLPEAGLALAYGTRQRLRAELALRRRRNRARGAPGAR